MKSSENTQPLIIALLFTARYNVAFSILVSNSVIHFLENVKSRMKILEINIILRSCKKFSLSKIVSEAYKDQRLFVVNLCCISVI
jgi:hypothetical protein